MKFRFGLFVGLVAGYILGTRAGRERYEQIVAVCNKVRSNEQLHQASDLAERSTRKTRSAAGNALVSTATMIRDRAAR